MVKGILEVQVIDAKGLADTDVIGDIDPYVLIQYRSQERKSSTTTRSEGRNYCWNETFKFVVHSPIVDSNHNNDKLIIRIMDHDTFTTNDFIGQATINIRDVIAIGMEKGTCELKPTKYSVVLEDLSYNGEIKVGVKFTIQENEEEANETNEFGGWTHSFFS